MILENQLLPYHTSILPNGSWLVFSPHPDDESFGMGGSLLQARNAHIPVTIVIVTNGALGGNKKDLIAIRRLEVEKIALQLHLQQVEFWEQEDRGLQVNDILIQRVVTLLQTLQPHCVFFPSPMEPHPDHRSTAQLVWQGMSIAQYQGAVFHYEISVQSQINTLVDISAEMPEKQLLMQHYASQLQENHYLDIVTALNKTRTYTLDNSIQYAEGFYRYPHLQQSLGELTLARLQYYWQEDNATQDYFDLQTRYQSLTQTLQTQQQQIQHLQQAQQQLLQSNSWKITRSLRKTKRIYHNLRKAITLLKPQIIPLLSQPLKLKQLLQQYWHIYQHKGLQAVKIALVHGQTSPLSRLDYAHWVKQHVCLHPTDHQAIQQHLQSFSKTPAITLIVPIKQPQADQLLQTIQSVQQQLYPHWQLYFIQHTSTPHHIISQLQQYVEQDQRISLYTKEHITAQHTPFLHCAYIAFLEAGDLLAKQALYFIAEILQRHPESKIIYTDEDKITDQGEHYDPYFKPDWNLVLLRGQHYLHHLSVYQCAAIQQAGGIHHFFSASQYWDLALRVSEQCQDHEIQHIPHLLYHHRYTTKQPDNHQQERAILQAHFARQYPRQQVDLHLSQGKYWHVRYPIPKPAPLVSLIIPTRNGYSILQRCIESLYQHTQYPHFEVLIVDNQSDDPKTLAYFKTIQQHYGCRIISYDAAFNYAAINNYAVTQSQGEIIGFLNNDIEIISPDWLDEMLAYAVQERYGAVGNMLYYPDGSIQHAGVILGMGGVAGHPYAHQKKGYRGQYHRACLAQNMSAVTAACLVVRRSIFDAIQGFNATQLAIAFNDVDFCLRIAEKGYYNVWTPFAKMYHYESASRGYEDTPEKKARFQQECAYMYQRWGTQLQNDPTFNPNLDLQHGDFRWSMKSRAKQPWKHQQ